MNSDWSTFLTNRNARIEQDRVVHFGHPASELARTETETTLIDLSHLGLIRFSGEDAQSFLQGQLSCDLQEIDSGRAGYGGYCTPKGRLLSCFLIWQDVSEESYLMQLPVELVDSMIKRFRMFVLRAKVSIQDSTDDFIRFGIVGKNAQASLQNSLPDTVLPDRPLTVTSLPDGQIICHSEYRFEIVTSPIRAPLLWKDMNKSVSAAGAAGWDWLEIREGIPVILKTAQEQFIPQMVNLDIVGGVSFKKGCYPGQEIVARTQYLGKVKRRMYRAHVDSSHSIAPGDSLFSADTRDQACGMIVNAAPCPAGGTDVLAVIQTDSMKMNEVHWKTPSGPTLVIQSLPYPIP